MTASPDAYRAATAAVGLADRSNRVRLEVSGPDRVRFLQNLTTNDVKRLTPGRGHEAFVTSPQGKTLGFVIVLATESGLLVRADPGSVETLVPHLGKYGIFEDVQIEDRSSATFEYHLAGPLVDEMLGRLGTPPTDEVPLSHGSASIGGLAVRIIRESPTGRPGLTLIGPAEDAGAVAGALRDAGAPVGLAGIDSETFEALRIEAGTPVFGRDVTADNLPQELGRDERAISFVKGCYLGQETVARIDALGHVNKLLKGLRFPADSVPAPGGELLSGGKVVGRITSTALSPGWGGPIGLGYVRTTHAAAGSEVAFSLDGRTYNARVADLPMLPPGGPDRGEGASSRS